MFSYNASICAHVIAALRLPELQLPASSVAHVQVGLNPPPPAATAAGRRKCVPSYHTAYILPATMSELAGSLVPSGSLTPCAPSVSTFNVVAPPTPFTSGFQRSVVPATDAPSVGVTERW